MKMKEIGKCLIQIENRKRGNQDNAEPLTNKCRRMIGQKPVHCNSCHSRSADSILTQHPRYVRYLGTCFNPDKQEAYVISDYIAGCTLLDLQKSLQLRDLLDLSEEDKVQAAIDII